MKGRLVDFCLSGKKESRGTTSEAQLCPVELALVGRLKSTFQGEREVRATKKG